MIQYTKEELISSSTISRNFSEILNNLVKHKLEKVAVIRNNKIEAVILPIENYENIINFTELSDHLDLYKQIKDREKSATFVDFDVILKENGLSLNDL
jgi:PHD/YefM family antitoxin component YafN of YafNO toxin-antitoxin module